MSANIRGKLVLDIADYLTALGCDPARVFAKAGLSLDAVPDQDARVPVEAPMELIDISAQLVDQQDFGLRLARFRGMPDLGPVALLLREQDTLGQALTVIAQSFYLHSNALYLSIVDGGDTVILAADLVTSGTGLSRQSADMIVCAILEMLRNLLGPQWRPAGITLRNSQVLPLATYRQHFGMTPEFDQEYNAIMLHRDDLSLPLRHEVINTEQAAQAVIDDLDRAREAFVYRVQQLIVLTLPQGKARAERVARLLQIDRRTLHRRLAKSGVSFSELLHKVRLEFALQYVRGSDRSLSEITLLVGFESLAVFSRWFRQATGQSPRAYRDQAQPMVD